MSEFMCNCKPEGQAECDAVLKEAMEDLKTTPEKFLNDVVYTLQWAMPNGWIGGLDGIGCDMWCGVSIQMQKFNEETKKYDKPEYVYAQCDVVEHGIAKAYLMAMEKANASIEN